MPGCNAAAYPGAEPRRCSKSPDTSGTCRNPLPCSPEIGDISKIELKSGDAIGWSESRSIRLFGIRRRNVGAFFGSLHGTLNHLLVTDRIWMRRLTGEGDHPAKLNAIMFDELGTLESARTAEDQRIVRYVDGLGEDDIGRQLDYSTTSGVPQRNRLGDILAHLFNHQTHHRGQAHAILTVLGVPEPPVLDLLAMYRAEAQAQPSRPA